MFAANYFAPRYFPETYFPEVGDTVVGGVSFSGVYYNCGNYYQLGRVFPRGRFRDPWRDNRVKFTGWHVYLTYGRSSVGSPWFSWLESYSPGSNLTDLHSAGSSKVAAGDPGSSKSEGIG